MSPERAGAAAAALGPARGGGEGGRGPPAPVTAGGPAPGPGVRASPPRGRQPLLELLRGRAQRSASTRCPDPGPLRPQLSCAGRALLRTAAAAAAAREGGGRGRGRDESPRGEGAAAQPLPQRPGRRPLDRPLPVAQGPRLMGIGTRSGCRTASDAGDPPDRNLGKVTPRVTRGLRGRFRGRASDFKLWNSDHPQWDPGVLAGTSK